LCVDKGAALAAVGKRVSVGEYFSLISAGVDYVHEFDDLDIVEISARRAVLVRRMSLSAGVHGLWKAAEDPHTSAFELIGRTQAVLEYSEAVGALEFPDGYCYLQLVKPTSRLFMQTVLGSYPTLAQLLEHAQHLVDRDNCYSAMTLVSESLAHVPRPGTGSTGCVAASVDPALVVVGGKPATEPVPERAIVRNDAVALLEVLRGRQRGVLAHYWTKGFSLSSVQTVQSSQVLMAKSHGLTRDGFYQFHLSLKPAEPVYLVLPKGVYVQLEDAMIGSDILRTFVFFQGEMHFTFLYKSPHSYKYIGEQLGPDIAYSSDVSNRLKASWDLSLSCLLARPYATVEEEGIMHVDWGLSEFHMVRKTAQALVIGQCIKPKGEDSVQVSAVPLHDPLDTYLACETYRLEGVVSERMSRRFVVPEEACVGPAVYFSFRSDREGIGQCLEVDEGLKLCGSEARVAVAGFLGRSTFRLVGFQPGDRFSWRTKHVADSYSYDCENDSVGCLSDGEFVEEQFGFA